MKFDLWGTEVSVARRQEGEKGEARRGAREGRRGRGARQGLWGASERGREQEWVWRGAKEGGKADGSERGMAVGESGEKGTVRVESAKEGAEKATHHIHHQIIFTEYSTYVVAKQLRAQQLACLIACIRPTFLSCANSISSGNKRRKRGGGCGKGREW